MCRLSTGAGVDAPGVLAAVGANLSFSIGVVLTKRFAYLSLAATALAFVFWFNGIRRLPAAAPMIYSTLLFDFDHMRYLQQSDSVAAHQ
jgi:drug/metabolite transporter (DMT)-like permease